MHCGLVRVYNSVTWVLQDRKVTDELGLFRLELREMVPLPIPVLREC